MNLPLKTFGLLLVLLAPQSATAGTGYANSYLPVDHCAGPYPSYPGGRHCEDRRRPASYFMFHQMIADLALQVNDLRHEVKIAQDAADEATASTRKTASLLDRLLGNKTPREDIATAATCLIELDKQGGSDRLKLTAESGGDAAFEGELTYDVTGKGLNISEAGTPITLPPATREVVATIIVPQTDGLAADMTLSWSGGESLCQL